MKTLRNLLIGTILATTINSCGDTHYLYLGKTDIEYKESRKWGEIYTTTTTIQNEKGNTITLYDNEAQKLGVQEVPESSIDKIIIEDKDSRVLKNISITEIDSTFEGKLKKKLFTKYNQYNSRIKRALTREKELQYNAF